MSQRNLEADLVPQSKKQRRQWQGKTSQTNPVLFISNPEQQNRASQLLQAEAGEEHQRESARSGGQEEPQQAVHQAVGLHVLLLLLILYTIYIILYILYIKYYIYRRGSDMVMVRAVVSNLVTW